MARSPLQWRQCSCHDKGQTLSSILKRTQFAHEVSVVAFSKLKAEAYVDADTTLSYDDWNEEQCKQSPTFFFWDLILRLQMWILTFVRAHREQTFSFTSTCWRNWSSCSSRWMQPTTPIGCRSKFAIRRTSHHLWKQHFKKVYGHLQELHKSFSPWESTKHTSKLIKP